MDMDAGKAGIFLKKCRRRIPVLFDLLTIGILALMANGCAGSPDRLSVENPYGDRFPREQGYHFEIISDLNHTEGYRHSDKSDTSLPESPDFDDYVHYAIRHNPELKASFYRWRVSLEQVPQAKSLPDPQATFGIVIDQVDRDAEYMGERYAMSQMFPWFGKLKLRGDMAMEAANAEARKFEDIRLQLINRVGRAYYEYAYIHQAINIARENLELVMRLESVARAMYRAGTVSLSDVNRAQVEIGRMEDQVHSLEDMSGLAAAELNNILGRSAHEYVPPVSVSESFDQEFFELADHFDEQQVALARQNNPGIAAMRHEMARQRHGIELARKDYYPDFTLGLEYARDGSARMATMDRGGSDILALMVSVNIPVRREKYDAGTREMMARAVEASGKVRSVENRLETDVKRALFDYRDGRRKMQLYGSTILPKARQSLTITEAAYRTGDTGFSDLIDAQRVLLEFELAYRRAAAESSKAFIRVLTLSGQDTGSAVITHTE